MYQLTPELLLEEHKCNCFKVLSALVSSCFSAKHVSQVNNVT